MFTKLIGRRGLAGPPGIKAAIALVFTACLLVTGALTADAATPDMRGSWALDVKVGNNRSVQTLEVSSMDMGSGAFRGDIIYSAQRAAVAGTVSGSKVTFQSTPTKGSPSNWVGDLSGNGAALKVSGTVTPGDGPSGTFGGSRITAAVPLDGSGNGGTQANRPPLPSGARELSPGQLPRQCTAEDTGMQGYYFSNTAKQWVSAPFCFGKWGNLEASGSQIVAAGASVTVTAIPTDGSNSGTYAPQTQSIQWEYPGKVVSGCGAADLSCTVIPAKVATSEWQWFEFHVAMPRTFFIDSPGDLCGGQHLCAGARTNAWTYVGIAPGSASTDQAPAVIGGGGPAGGQGSGAGGGSGSSLGVILGTAAVVGAAALGAIALAARQNPMGRQAEIMASIGNLFSSRRGSSGKSAGSTGSSAGTTGKGGGTASGKGGGMSQIDTTALAQQLGQMSQTTQPASPPSPPVSPDPHP